MTTVTDFFVLVAWVIYLNDNISDKLSSIFSVFLPLEPECQSCISWWNHVYTQYSGLNSTRICRICPLYHRPVPNSAKFRENIEIPWKWANSMARLQIPHSAENCGPYSQAMDGHVMCCSIISSCWLAALSKIVKCLSLTRIRSYIPSYAAFRLDQVRKVNLEIVEAWYHSCHQSTVGWVLLFIVHINKRVLWLLVCVCLCGAMMSRWDMLIVLFCFTHLYFAMANVRLPDAAE